MSKQHTGGMPKGRRKRGNLGGPDRTKIEIGLHVEEKAWILEAAAMRRITVSQYCAEHSVAAAKKDLTAKLRS
jgi:uncharacterized protein (DUF1778 family)